MNVLRTLIFIFLLVSSAAAQVKPGDNLDVTGIPDIPKRIVDRTNQYQNVRSAGLSDWDPHSGGMYISTRFGNTSQLHYLAEAGAARRQLTFFQEPVSGASADPRPGKNGLALTRDVGGGEYYQIYYFNRDNGKTRLLTDGESRNSGANWSNSGSVFAYSSNRRNGKDTDIWIMDPDSPDKTWNLFEESGYWYASAWSPDDSRIVAGTYISANEGHLYIIDLESRKRISLDRDSEKKVSYGGVQWSPDGKTILYSSDEAGEFKHLFSYNVESGARLDLTPDLKWDLQSFRISDDGRHLAYTLNEDGAGTLHLFRLPEMQPVALPAIPTGVIYGLSFSPDNNRLALTVNGTAGPGDIYTVNLQSRELSRWTYSEVGGLNTDLFATPELIHYPTFDKAGDSPRMIPAFVFKPKNGSPKNASEKAPVIISIHGGPEGQSRPYFSSTYQYWVNEVGCAVILPNVRGSTGYGKSYLALDNGYNREESVKDIGALLDWIETQPELDSDRIAVFGGSYGGYMVLASMTNYPDRIKCGVDIVGISNFVTFLENTKSYRRDLRRVEYGDERDEDMRKFLETISPLNNAGKIRSALFVAQGENDPRVPASEARQIVSAVKDNGIPVWSLFAKDEGHGFRKKGNRDYFGWATILFFEEHLLK